MLTALAAASSPLVVMLVALAVFAVRVHRRGMPATPGASRGPTAIATPFLTRYILWLIGPFEVALARMRATPQAVTVGSLALCAGAGVATAFGAWIVAGWLYVAAGLADVLDGRMARLQGTAGPRGAFLDSVSDRWGELMVLGACALSLGAPWMQAAAILALGASQMVSYTRARGEGLGIALAGGTMQRAERMILTSLGLLVGGVFASVRPDVGEAVLGGTLGVIALASTVTAVERLRMGLRALAPPGAASPAAKVPGVATLETARRERAARPPRRITHQPGAQH